MRITVRCNGRDVCPRGGGAQQSTVRGMNEFTVQVPGALLRVRDSHADGPPLLMLHGGPGVPDSMQTTIAPMLPRMRAISFDQRGVGRSSCRDGAYDIASYLGDIEGIREHLGLASWHVLGHSWGGLLAQAYAARHPGRVASLVLSSSSLGVGQQWKQTKRVCFRTGRRRAGGLGTLRLYFFGTGLLVPGPIARAAMSRVMTQTWHNYFIDPSRAPDPDPQWLAGCSPTAMLRTDRAVSRENDALLEHLPGFAAPVLVLYGEHDIFGSASDVVRLRFPRAEQVTLPGSGHLHWLENPAGYRDVLEHFFTQVVRVGP
jgi:proline iminopeptidase